MDKIRVGVVGGGKMGKNHILAYSSSNECRLVGISENNFLLHASLYDSFDVPIYQDYKKMIDEVDAVSIVTPAKTHFSIAKFFLENKKHVLLEKPISCTTKEAEELIKIAKKNNTVFALGHLERFNSAMEELPNLVKAETPLFIEIIREGAYDSRIFDVDVVMDLMIHDIDLILYYLCNQININSAYGINVHSGKTDIVNVQLTTGNGILVNLISSRASQTSKRNWKLVFKNKIIEIDLINKNISCFSEGNTKVIKLGSPEFANQNTALTQEIKDFLTVIKFGGKPKTSGLEGYIALNEIQNIKSRINQLSLINVV